VNDQPGCSGSAAAAATAIAYLPTADDSGVYCFLLPLRQLLFVYRLLKHFREVKIYCFPDERQNTYVLEPVGPTQKSECPL